MPTIQDRIFAEYEATLKENGVMSEAATDLLCCALRTGKKPKTEELIAALSLPVSGEGNAQT